MNMIEVPVTPKMENFVWSPSKLATFVGDLDWKNGCGVRLYFDQFVDEVYDVRNKAFTFGTYVHEIMENYHAGDMPPSVDMVKQWINDLWIATEYKKQFTRLFGEGFLQKLERNEPVGVADFSPTATVDMKHLELGYVNVNMCEEMILGRARRWMMLGYDSEQDEIEHRQKAEKLFRKYLEIPYIKPLEIEQKMTIRLGGAQINGRIDRIDAAEIGGAPGFRVVDYKTSKKVKTSNELLKDFQMICYHIAVKEKYNVPDNVIEGGLLFLKPEVKVKGNLVPMPIVMSTVRITPEIVKKADMVVAEAASRVKRGVFHYVDRSGTWQCPYCGYYGKCGRPEE